MTTLRRLLRRPQVSNLTGDKRSTLYLRVSEGLFPKPVKIGARASAWPEDEVSAINAARIAGKSNEEIRALVAKLEAARKAAK
jgi:prophage regulatory protein